MHYWLFILDLEDVFGRCICMENLINIYSKLNIVSV